MITKTIFFDTVDSAKAVFGSCDENLGVIEERFTVRLIVRDTELKITGYKADVERSVRFFEELKALVRKGKEVGKGEFDAMLKSFSSAKDRDESLYYDRIEVPSKRRFIIPKTPGQKNYIKVIEENDIVFSIGPAGTGKTYLAMAMAVKALFNNEVARIILTRPAVEAGESLGFLPGDMLEKVNPYLRPLHDALYDMMDMEKIQRYIDRDMIEVAPLAFMRGRTLNDSFIILDEAQNCTVEQMKMFLTRLGNDSKAVITGDVTQVDLPVNKKSGLIQVQSVLKKIEGIEFFYFSEKDVVRHDLVQKIIKAYESFEQTQEPLK